MNEEFEDYMPGVTRHHRPESLKQLARSTRFTPHEIKLIYRGFKQECPSGVVDEDSFKHIFSQFFPLGDSSQYAHFVFNTIKHKQDGKVNFEEFLEVLSRVARGSRAEKLSWVFNLYDVDGDGRISASELAAVTRAVFALLGPATVPPAAPNVAAEHATKLFAMMDEDHDGVITREELERWMCKDPRLLESLDTLDTLL